MRIIVRPDSGESISKPFLVLCTKNPKSNSIFCVAYADDVSEAVRWIFKNGIRGLYYEVWDGREYEWKLEGRYVLEIPEHFSDR